MKSRWPNFPVEELACPCCGVAAMQDGFMDRLQAMRTKAGFPFVLPSAYRCPRHNRRIGGSPNSAHMYGRAVDVALVSHRIYLFWKLAYEFGFTGHGHGEHKGFGHVDDMTPEDGFPQRPNAWTYK